MTRGVRVLGLQLLFELTVKDRSVSAESDDTETDWNKREVKVGRARPGKGGKRGAIEWSGVKFCVSAFSIWWEIPERV